MMRDSPDRRTPVVVAGRRGPTAAVARALLGDGSVLVHHGLDRLGEGVVQRTVVVLRDGRPYEHVETLELAHGCLSCTLRTELLPLLRRLHPRSGVDRIVLHLDPRLEPQALCWAIAHVPVVGVVGRIDAPAGRDVRIEAVLTCVDAGTWLEDASGDAMVESFDGDERTVAQVTVGQVAFADALVVAGHGADGWQQAKLYAVLARLAPGSPIGWGGDLESVTPRLLAAIPPGARRGAASDAFAPLLRGQPPLSYECGVVLVEFTAHRPFHPRRLHEAIDVLLDGVVTARGRIWLATQPDHALWLESAGPGLRVARAGRWLAAMTPAEQDEQDPTRRALAALTWDDEFGDRHISLVVLVHGADPSEIDRTLQWALLSDDEMRTRDRWHTWADPFGASHAEPCEANSSPYVESDRIAYRSREDDE